MSNPDSPNLKNNDDRNMWITVAVIVLILVGGMGINMLIHHDTSPTTEVSNSSK